MSEAPEHKTDQPEQPKKSASKKPFVVGAIVVVAILGAIAIQGGWLAALTGNGGPSHEDSAPNTPPHILTLSASTERIAPLQITTVTCQALDADGDQLEYTWSASGGEIHGEGPVVDWLAPDTEGLYRVFVSVDDGRGGNAQESLALRVRTNRPPEILVMRSEVDGDSDWVVPGARVLVECEAEDLDGDSLSYAWSSTGGEVFGQGPAVVWIASSALGRQWITVTVTDTYGAVAERSIPIAVNAAQPPAIHGFNLKALDTELFRPYGDSWRIFKERSCAIEAIVDDEEGVYIYDWSAELGTITADGPNAVWVAPASPKGWVDIVLEVSDRHGNRSSASVRIFVETCPSCI